MNKSISNNLKKERCMQEKKKVTKIAKHKLDEITSIWLSVSPTDGTP